LPEQVVAAQQESASEPQEEPEEVLSDGPDEEPAPIEPRGGERSGGERIRWTSEERPVGVTIGRRHCAPLKDGVFVVPMCDDDLGPHPLVAAFEDGEQRTWERGFTYWIPGEFRAIDPCRVSMKADIDASIVTNDLGARIMEVSIGGVACDVRRATSSQVTVKVPFSEADGPALVVVKARNGNIATSMPEAFLYYQPDAFGFVGNCIELVDGRATRVDTLTAGVCLGAAPLRRCPQGRYYEIRVLEVRNSTRSLAVGVTTRKGDDILNARGRIRKDEARALERVWLVGYESRGALFINDKEEERVASRSWRPLQDAKEGVRIGVLWTTSAEIVIYQDGEERVRAPAKGRVPGEDEDLFALVDVQGSVKSVELVDGAAPPPDVTPEDNLASNDAQE